MILLFSTKGNVMFIDRNVIDAVIRKEIKIVFDLRKWARWLWQRWVAELMVIVFERVALLIIQILWISKEVNQIAIKIMTNSTRGNESGSPAPCDILVWLYRLHNTKSSFAFMAHYPYRGRISPSSVRHGNLSQIDRHTIWVLRQSPFLKLPILLVVPVS